MGVRGILCGKDDYVIGMDIVKSEKDELLVIMEKGLGKKTTLSEFPKQSRGGKGVKACETTQRTGKVITSHIIEPNCDSIILTSVNGQVVKMPISSVPKLSRATQGVILMRFSDPKDSLAAATCLTKEK